MRIPIRGPVLLLLLLTACAAGETASPVESDRSSASPGDSLPPSAGTTFSQLPPTAQPGQGESLTGILGSDAVEGGCAYLQAADGTRYEVLYPDGWTVVMSPLQLIDPDGKVRARAGDLVTVRGATASDMASICQIGPIFQAAEVVAP